MSRSTSRPFSKTRASSPRAGAWRGSLAAAVVVGLALAQESAGAEEPDCSSVDVQYDVSANLKIAGTTMGAADGVYRIGPGKVVLRFDEPRGPRTVKLVEYDLRQDFTVESKALFFRTKVITQVELRAGGTPPSAVAEGTLDGRTLRWSGQAHDVRSDGTLRCEGSMCGKFGAPPSGVSQVHVGPRSIELRPFVFGSDMKTFAMPFALVSATESPKQRTLVALAGREAGRKCVARE